MTALHFRLTPGWHDPIIPFGPARIAPFGNPALRSPMATASERSERIHHIERPTDREDKEKAKAVELAVGQIEKQFGKGSIMRLGGKDAIAPIAAISTGSISVDWALGVGGLPRGRVIEVFGPESSGKTTLALQVIAQAQKLGGVAAFIDAEHALDAQYAQKLGVDLDNLLVRSASSRASSRNRRRASSSSTSCGRRSGSCSAIRRPRPAAGR
jgi:hypothetical protein